MLNSHSRRRIWLLVSVLMLAYRTVVAAQSLTFRWVNHCGDWYLRTDLWEQCDDGNYSDNDGCSRNCEVEPKAAKEKLLPSYDPDFINETTPYKVFMDSKWVEHIIPEGKEVCDYWLQNGVVCEPGYGGKCFYCTEWCFLEEVTWESCGDWIVNHLQEECDDGNMNNNDWCSAICKKENTMIAPLPNTITSSNNTVQIREGEYIPLPLPTVNNQVIPVWNNKPTTTIVTTNTVNIQEITKPVITQPTNSKLEPSVKPEPLTLPSDTTPKVTITSIGAVAMTIKDWPIVANETTSKGNLSTTMQPASIRQNIAMRTSPVKTGIGITSPYPDSLSDTWARVLVSSKIIFMRVFSFLMVIYLSLGFWIQWRKSI